MTKRDRHTLDGFLDGVTSVFSRGNFRCQLLQFAWIAEVDPQTLSLIPHVEAGIDGYLAEVPSSIDLNEPSGRGPSGRAIRTQKIQTSQNALTDRQRAALEAAAYSGFFEWPRDTTGEEVAESLDIAPSTFSQHLRKAQQKVFQSLFPSPPPV